MLTGVVDGGVDDAVLHAELDRVDKKQKKKIRYLEKLVREADSYSCATNQNESCSDSLLCLIARSLLSLI